MEKISRDDVNALPIRRYEGEIVLVETPEALARAVADIRAEPVVGFDTETRPAFRPGESYLPSLAQVATARAVFLFRLPGNEAAMIELLQSAATVKAGVSMADDLRGLKKMFPFDEQAILDLGTVARRHGLKQSGVRNLTALLLGWRITKGAKTTNWAARRLTPQQIAYAASDAWACRELYFKFKELGAI
ncbi:MAG: 3'-5' exonuclease [Betaproteobacteria bacterium]